MRNTLIYVFMMFFAFAANSQNEVVNKFDTVGFLNQVLTDKRAPISLYREIYPGTIEEIKKHIQTGKYVRRMEDEKGKNLSDSIILSGEETVDLLRQIDPLRSFICSETTASSINLKQITLIEWDSTNIDNGWIKYHLVPPLLFHNCEYCLFYYDYSCGLLCGQGELIIFRKEETGWKRWKTLVNWIS